MAVNVSESENPTSDFMNVLNVHVLGERESEKKR